MSFSKARLHRFNDISSYTPSPADYNVPSKGNTTGATIPKSDRFAELRSPVSSEICSLNSTNGNATFRTPNPAKKNVSLRKQKTENDDTEALKEKIVECSNKDLFIQELTELIEEMKQKISDLKENELHLISDRNALQDSIENLKEIDKANVQNLKLYEDKVKILTENITKLIKIKDLIKKDCIELKQDNEKDLRNVLHNIEALKTLICNLSCDYQKLVKEKEDQLKIKDEEIKELQNVSETLKEDHLAKIEQLEKMYEKQIQELESDILKTVTNMHNIIDDEKVTGESHLKELEVIKQKEIDCLIKKYDNEKVKLIDDFEAKIKQLEENHKEVTILAEIQMKEKHDDLQRGWILKLEETKAEAEVALKEYQTMSKRKMTQCEIEKNKAVFELLEQKKELNHFHFESFKIKADYNSLQNEYRNIREQFSRTIVELNNIREEKSKQVQQYESVISKTIHDKHLYEVTVQKTHKTVEALINRLMKSDRDVEQLKTELAITEKSKLEVESECNQLLEELEIVTELCDASKRQNEFDILKFEEELLRKVDLYKAEAQEGVKSMVCELEKYKNDLKEVKDHLHDQQLLNGKAQEVIVDSQAEISRLESVVNEYSSTIVNLQSSYNDVQEELMCLKIKHLNNDVVDENSKLKTVIEFMHASENDLVKQIGEFKEQINVMNKECEKHQNEIREISKSKEKLMDNYNHLVVKQESLQMENITLKKTVSEQDGLIGPFRAHLQAYETEYKVLMNEKQSAEQEAKEIGLKYAQILGHQNQKQKIKHLTDLKKKNLELSDDKKKLELKIRAQARLIEKLKSEVKHSSTITPSNKENFGSPSVLLNSSRIDSPGPLKQLN